MSQSSMWATVPWGCLFLWVRPHLRDVFTQHDNASKFKKQTSTVPDWTSLDLWRRNSNDITTLMTMKWTKTHIGLRKQTNSCKGRIPWLRRKGNILIDLTEWPVNPTSAISCLNSRESGSLFIFINIFLYNCFLRVFLFAHGPTEKEYFSNRPICPIDGALTDIFTPSQRGAGSDGTEEVLQNWSFKIRCSLVSYQDTYIFLKTSTENTVKHILSLADRAEE